MHELVAFCKKMRFGRMFAILAAGFVLSLNVVCSNGNATGARPNNPPVQMGGQNNPHKAGGDGYSEYQMSTDPAVSKRDRADITAGQLVATAAVVERSNQSKQDISATQQKSGNAMSKAQQMPEPRQEVIDRSNLDVNILEKTGRTFKEAAKHLTGSTEQSIERTGVTQSELNH